MILLSSRHAISELQADVTAELALLLSATSDKDSLADFDTSVRLADKPSKSVDLRLSVQTQKNYLYLEVDISYTVSGNSEETGMVILKNFTCQRIGVKPKTESFMRLVAHSVADEVVQLVRELKDDKEYC